MGEKQGPQKSKVEVFGLAGAEAFDVALTGIHHFAQATGCPAGADVFDWISNKHFELVAHDCAKLDAAHRASPANEGEGAQ